ncbi:hypothetical protein PanWU01x14_152900 [Parasponia andersonii]|uniref:Uncharacterized protein n=1 Tax=Parasponia andersonii TaxID=3476 RepID=A0A2P5CHG9_PARAD|nr:hypothetical protein PanWU01x14_152900 [Parasponia andersonii]
MCEAVFLGDRISVNPRVLVGDRHDRRFDLEVPFDFDLHGICILNPRHRDYVWWRSRFPCRTFAGGEEDWLTVQGKGEAVDSTVPFGSFLGANVELVIVEKDPYGLDPSEVSCHVRVSFSDEVAIDVEVAIRDKAEISVFLAMEIKCYSISTNESRVLAHSAWPIAI